MVAWTSFLMDPGYLPWFWLLVPLLVLYLIRPRPVDQTIPSLMFLIQDKGKAIRNSFLRYLYRDFVLFLQLLILVLLVTAACRPYLELSKDSLVGNAIIVLDASASMQTDDGRWDEALRIAEDNLARQNTIILVKNRPVIIARDVTRAEAQTLLNDLEPSDTVTNLYGGIVAAREFVDGADSVVTVISDFRNTEEQQDYRAAASTVIATGAVVNLHGVGTSNVENVGIISLDVTDARTRIGVRNFGTESIVATVRVEDFEQAVPLSAGATEYVTIETPPGVTEVELSPRDAFMLDNTASIANADRFDVRILVITNDDAIRTRPWWLAMQSIHEKTPLVLELEVATPPQLPRIDHDIVVFADVSASLLVQRTIRDAAQNAQDGKAIVIMSQPDLFSIDYEGLLPVTSSGKGVATAVQAGTFSSLTKDIEFGDMQEYHIVTGNTGQIVAVAAADSTPVLSLYPYGTGQVFYYGIDDDQSSFPLEPTYPVFWKRIIDRVTGRIALDRLNVETGQAAIGLPTPPKETPGDMEWDGFYDKQGIYEYDDRFVAANFLSAAESDVSAQAPDAQLVAAAGTQAQATKPKEFTGALALAALALLFLELLIVKYRGDF